MTSAAKGYKTGSEGLRNKVEEQMAAFEILPYVLTCIIAAATPGPGTLAVINSSLTSGTRKTLPLMVGILFGMALVALITMLGLSVLILSSAWVFGLVKYLGCLYICYMGVGCLLSARSTPLSKDSSSKEPLSNELELPLQPESQFTFHSGLMLAAINPKTIIFFTSLLPSFIRTDEALVSQNIHLTAILLTCTFLVHLTYSRIGSYASKFIATQKQLVDLITGVLFILMALMLVFGVA